MASPEAGDSTPSRSTENKGFTSVEDELITKETTIHSSEREPDPDYEDGKQDYADSGGYDTLDPPATRPYSSSRKKRRLRSPKENTNRKRKAKMPPSKKAKRKRKDSYSSSSSCSSSSPSSLSSEYFIYFIFHILNIFIQGTNSIRILFYNLALLKLKYLINYLQIN